MRWLVVLRRIAVAGGLLFALWLGFPGLAAADVPCTGVSYDNGLPELPGMSNVDPCAGQAQTGAIVAGAAALAATLAAAAASALQGGIPSPGEASGAQPDVSAVPDAQQPMVPGSGQTADGNTNCRTGGDPVDVVSGQMITSGVDADLPGLLPLVLRRAYASGYQGGRLHGPGWSSTVDQRLELGAQGIQYFGDDAQILRYPLPAQPGQVVLPVEGARWPLVWEADGSLRVEDPHTGWTRHFTPSSHRAIAVLGSLTDRNGHRITIHRKADIPVGFEHSGGYRVAVDTADHPAGPRITGLRLLDGTHDDHGTLLRRFGYDSRGRLTTVVNASGAPLRYDYDQADRITSWTDRLGYRYDYTYDEAGRVTRGTGPGGTLSAAFEYHPLRRVTVVTDSLGQRTEYHYDRRHHITRVVDPLGNSTLTESDRSGRPLAHTDELGNTTRYTLDEHGDPVRIDQPDGTSITTRYNEFRQPVQVTDPGGAVWRYSYDAHGNLLTKTDPLGAVTAYSYDRRGRLTAVADALGHVQRVRTDPAGLPLGITDAAGNETRLVRDAFGRVTESHDPLGNRTVLAWSPESLLISRTHPDGAVERWHYDAEGNQTGYENPDGALAETAYGPFSRPVTRTGPDGARYEFGYDTELRLASVTGPTGLIWRYERDAAGRLIGETDFNGRRLGYHLDAAGRLVERVNGVGQRIRYRRDALGKTVEAQHDSGAASVYAYDANGHLIRARNPDATLERTRDALGRVTSETVNGLRTTWEYDPRGHCVRRTTPTGAASVWSHDATGRPSELATPAGQLRFGYDPAGRETTRRLGAAAAVTQTFDTSDRRTAQSIWALDASGGSTPLRQRTYAYRRDGNLAAIRDAQSGVRQFDLDSLGQVTAVDGDGWSERYAYDALGNLTHGEWPGPGDEAKGGREYSGTLIRHAGRTHYEHDAQGRLTRKAHQTLSGQSRQWRYEWDADDRLTQAITPDGAVWRYRYDPLGRRIAKQRLGSRGEVAEQTTFAWDGTNLAEQVRWTSDAPPATTVWDYRPGTPVPLAQRQYPGLDAAQQGIDQRFHAIVTDLVGMPTDLVDTEGRLTGLHAAGLWGAGEATGCPLRFPGQYADTETGLHYNYFRYYDPATARYLTPDPLGLEPAPNPYAYVDNPHTGADPLGLAATNDPSEIFYRAMSLAELESFKKQGIWPRNGESFVTQELDYLKKAIHESNAGSYDVLVTMYTNPGTQQKLLDSGARDRGLSREMVKRGLDGLPVLQKGNVNEVHVKAERGHVTYGLRGKGEGSSAMFNSQLIDYEVGGLP
ncbi:RHS repeat-associated core domain-containing protein [Amycolatopsis sp. NPDC058986]|uniref:RHS repeat-associated core domain-containing protein n=1 Tax=unclassified Amycolatopsis TaxID=2618356 RepID=UPI0036735977